jgi:small subunit ribosomal protein S20
MPQRKCAAKRLRIDKKLKLHNNQLKIDIKKELKSFRALVADGKKSEAQEKIKIVFAKLDRASTKGILHKNTAARRKSNLSTALNSIK